MGIPAQQEVQRCTRSYNQQDITDLDDDPELAAGGFAHGGVSAAHKAARGAAVPLRLLIAAVEGVACRGGLVYFINLCIERQ